MKEERLGLSWLEVFALVTGTLDLVGNIVTLSTYAIKIASFQHTAPADKMVTPETAGVPAFLWASRLPSAISLALLMYAFVVSIWLLYRERSKRMIKGANPLLGKMVRGQPRHPLYSFIRSAPSIEEQALAEAAFISLLVLVLPVVLWTKVFLLIGNLTFVTMLVLSVSLLLMSILQLRGVSPGRSIGWGIVISCPVTWAGILVFGDHRGSDRIILAILALILPAGIWLIHLSLATLARLLLGCLLLPQNRTMRPLVRLEDLSPEERADYLCRHGHYDKAIAELSKAITRTDNAYLRVKRAKILRKKAEKDKAHGIDGWQLPLERAEQDLSRALELYLVASKLEAAYDVYCERGQVRWQLGNIEGAMNDFTLAIQMQGGRGDAYWLRGLLNFSQRRFNEAIFDLDYAIEFFDTGLHENPADLLLSMLGTRGSEKAYRFLYRGRAYLETGELDKAISDFEQAEHGGIIMASAWKGLALFRQGKYEEAIAAIDKALRYAPTTNNFGLLFMYRLDSSEAALAHGWQAQVKMKLGKYREALMHCTQAIHFQPQDSRYYFLRAQILGLEGRVVEARRDFREAVQRESNPERQAEYYYEWAKVEASQGNVKEAVRYLQNAIERCHQYQARVLSEPAFQVYLDSEEFRGLLENSR